MRTIHPGGGAALRWATAVDFCDSSLCQAGGAVVYVVFSSGIIRFVLDGVNR
jgi:hypothetical protein